MHAHRTKLVVLSTSALAPMVVLATSTKMCRNVTFLFVTLDESIQSLFLCNKPNTDLVRFAEIPCTSAFIIMNAFCRRIIIVAPKALRRI